MGSRIIRGDSFVERAPAGGILQFAERSGIPGVPRNHSSGNIYRHRYFYWHGLAWRSDRTDPLSFLRLGRRLDFSANLENECEHSLAAGVDEISRSKGYRLSCVLCRANFRRFGYRLLPEFRIRPLLLPVDDLIASGKMNLRRDRQSGLRDLLELVTAPPAFKTCKG